MFAAMKKKETLRGCWVCYKAVNMDWKAIPRKADDFREAGILDIHDCRRLSPVMSGLDPKWARP